MGAIANKTHTIASNVTNTSTFTTTYPSGTSQASLQGSTGGRLVYKQAVFKQDATVGFTLSFGASTITITNNTGVTLAAGEVITLSFGDTTYNGSYNLSVGTAKGQAAAGDGSGAKISTLTATAAVPAGTRILELNHASTVIAATIADLAAFPGFLTVRNTSASGTAAHTVTLTNGTWNGTNKVITLDAPGEAITVRVDSAGRGQVIENTGSVGLSGT